MESANNVRVEMSVKFYFPTSNNQTECEAIIARLNLAKDMEVRHIRICSDSQVITSQVEGSYQAKDLLLRQYLQKVLALLQELDHYEVKYAPRE